MSFLSESSQSLVIAQGKNQIDINSIEFNFKKDDDLFELSRDDHTLSFQIQQERAEYGVMNFSKSIYQENLKINSEIGQSQENKKKRKQIFQKFKRPQTEIIVKQEGHIKTEDNLLNIFDSIFKTKVTEIVSANTPRMTKLQENNAKLLQQHYSRDKTPSAEKRQRLKIFGKKNCTGQFKGILPNELLQSQVIVKPTQPNNMGSPILKKDISNSLNFQGLEGRLSAIYVEDNQQFSREQIQIQNILQSQIFKDEQYAKMQNQSSFPVKLSKDQTDSIKEPIYHQGIVIIDKEVSSNKLISQSYEQVKKSVIQKPIEQSIYLKNDTSISINPQMIVQKYQEQSNGFLPYNSMVNFSNHKISQLSSPKGIQRSNQHSEFSSDNKLYQSQVIQSNSCLVKINYFEQQKRIPTFLKQIRKHISIYPNFYILKRNPNTSQCIRDQFNELFQLFSTAIKLLSEMCQKILDIKSKKKLYMNELINNLTLQFFMQSEWQKIINFQQFQNIRPKQNFQSRQWSFEKAKVALTNYQNIIQYYKSKGINLDVTSDKGRSKYFEIRQKFWDICGNMKFISQDIYCEMRSCQFPSHFYQFLAYLKSDFPSNLNNQNLNRVKMISNLFKILKSENELLINSKIGLHIKQKIDLQMKYLNPY